MRPAILINLKRCTGCWTCSLACKVGNNLPDEIWWHHVRTLGDGAGIDEPAGEWPNLNMSWMPIHKKDCTLCGGRIADGDEPFCTYNCPTKAMTFGDLEDDNSPISLRVKELRDLDFRIFQLPAWEETRAEIYYAER